MKKLTILALCLLAEVSIVEAQRALDDKVPSHQRTADLEQIKLNAPWADHLKPSAEAHSLKYSNFEDWEAEALLGSRPQTIWIENDGTENSRDKPQSLSEFIGSCQQQLPLKSIEELLEKSTVEGEDGWVHHRMVQHIKEVPIFGSVLLVHRKNGAYVRMNGTLYPTPDEVPEGILDLAAAQQAVLHDVGTRMADDKESPVMRLLRESEFGREVFYFHEGRMHRAWHIKIIPNIYENWEYIVDATEGTILNKWNNVCSMYSSCRHGVGPNSAANPPSVGNSLDLNGQSREFNTFEQNGTHFMLDANREMFRSLGSATTNPEGVIITADTRNRRPDTRGVFPSDWITSTSASSWDPKAVSAHFNAGFAYEYFRQIFGRNSINGRGGTIWSYINVPNPEEGGDFDNAFWNEKTMHYGNGKVAFSRPLQAAIDVAAHEMSHGVIQNEANLIYQGESGAINESIADFFGAGAEARMTGQLDWKIGNSVVNTNIFQSGALRDMENPHNGGQSLNDNGYQPRLYSERYRGKEDGGGVHINSGIPNHAFARIGNEIGLPKAEDLVYRALTVYLTRSSQFTDLRKAMEASAIDLFGANSAELESVLRAFDAVEISDGPATEVPQEAEVNPGLDFMIAVHSESSQVDLYQITETVDELAAPWLAEEALKPPSITDDGSILVFVAKDNTLKFVNINYNGQSQVETLSAEPIWRNVEISRDGDKIAALTTENDNTIWVFDLVNDRSKQFTLFNPTFTEGVQTGNVQFADALDFDFSGELLMYDASNLISSEGSDYTYWDIGFIEVYDNERQTFSDGNIFKLVSGLPDNVSIGNPVFSKNSPNIIAFDYVETILNQGGSTDEAEYSVVGANIETGDAKLIVGNNDLGGVLGFPSFSKNDEILVFNGVETDFLGQETPVIKAAFLGEDKISIDNQTESFSILEDHFWPVWFSNGERELNTTSVFSTSDQKFDVVAYPNPTTSGLFFEITLEKTENMQVKIHDLIGRTLLETTLSGSEGRQAYLVPGVEHLGSGLYLASIRFNDNHVGFRFARK